MSPLTIAITTHLNSDDTDDKGLSALIEGCLANDRRSQEMLYRKYYGRMMTTCLRFNPNPDDALEALNNGFYNVFKNLKQYKGNGSFDGWVYHIVRNAALDFVRKRIKYIETGSLDGLDADVELVENACEQLEVNGLLKLLESLPDATRTVFNLFALEGFTHKEIAKMLEISEGTSKWHAAEARKLLQSKLIQLYPHLKK
ncbi:MAG: RNA polymerase sigma factor [Sphingomonadales bacterium]